MAVNSLSLQYCLGSATAHAGLTEWLWKLFLYRVTIGTWNVAGKIPDEDLEIDDWLCTEEQPADMYIIG